MVIPSSSRKDLCGELLVFPVVIVKKPSTMNGALKWKFMAHSVWWGKKATVSCVDAAVQ